MTFDLIGRVIMAAIVLWLAYGTFLLLFVAKAIIPPDAPWSIRIKAAMMYILISGWILVRHQRVLHGFVLRQVNTDGDCLCPECVSERADG